MSKTSGGSDFRAKNPKSVDLSSFVEQRKGLKWIMENLLNKKLQPFQSKMMLQTLREARENLKDDLTSQGKWITKTDNKHEHTHDFSDAVKKWLAKQDPTVLKQIVSTDDEST